MSEVKRYRDTAAFLEGREVVLAADFDAEHQRRVEAEELLFDAMGWAPKDSGAVADYKAHLAKYKEAVDG